MSTDVHEGEDGDSMPRAARIDEELQRLSADPATRPMADSLGAMYRRIFHTGDMDEITSASGLAWLIAAVAKASAQGELHEVLCIASAPLIDLPYGPDGSYVIDDEYMALFGTELRLRDKVMRRLFPGGQPGVETQRHRIDFEAQLRIVLQASHLTVRAFETAIPHIILVQAQDPIASRVKEVLVFDAIPQFSELEEAPPLRQPWEVHTGAPPLGSEAKLN